MSVRQLEVGRTVRVSVPATSANLGPGFDCFGLALDWREVVDLEVIDAGYRVEVTGFGADQLPRDESHLILSSALTGLADLGWQAPGLALRGHHTLPHGRGLGSSAAAIVAGLLAARGLAGGDPDAAWLLRHATAIEGHPDNVAAAISGGFALVFEGSDGPAVVARAVHPAIAATVFVADDPLETRIARGLLPEVVPHVDAAANSARAALLVHALAADPDLLWAGTRDWLHQAYRRTAMPRSYELLTELRGAGRAAVISGAGPSVLVLGRRDELTGLSRSEVRGFVAREVGIGVGGRLEAVR